MNKFLFLLCFVIILSVSGISTSSKITIINNGYENIVITLPPTISPAIRPRLIANLKNVLWQSSNLLLNATKGRASFSSVTFLVPDTWGDIKRWLPRSENIAFVEEGGALDKKEQADIIVTNSNTTEYPYTLHHKGCGKPSLRIYLPAKYLMSGSPSKRSVEFVRFWSEFRYGVFPEGGFQDDDRFPLTFRVSGEKEDRITECVNKPFRIPQDCDSVQHCDKNHIKPSIMDQQYTNGTSFCEGHSGLGQIHIPDAPSKQNLLCSEEGTYFTVLRSLDFENGRNAPTRFQTPRELTFRYIKENSPIRVFVAIDVSSKMRLEDRYTVTKNAFSRFIIHDLPSGTNFSLMVFDGAGKGTFITTDMLIEGQESRISYLESQPFPEEPSNEPISYPEYALNTILEVVKNESAPAPHIILITTQFDMTEFMYHNLTEYLKGTEIHLHVLSFDNTVSSKQSTWFNLCKATNNQFISLGDDLLGNLYSGFASTVQASTKNVLVSQGYLNTLDEENIFFSASVDESISHSLTVSVTGPLFALTPLKYDSTVLKDPENQILHPQKQELLPAWIFQIPNPKVGTYTLKVWRKRRATSPILVTVTGMPSTDEDPITAKLWIEALNTDISPPPIQIFGEVRKGDYPVMNATVIAYIYHPNEDGISTLVLRDDGLGSIDVTKHDGIYSSIFTNFTSVGFYNVRLMVTGSIRDISAIRIGPSFQCCGSFFPSDEQIVTEPFERETGPVTFEVTTILDYDPYPPAKITDLRVSRSYGSLFVVNWTAVGNNYDTGVASNYEIKLFRDRSLIRNRFFDSGLEIYNETIETTDEAEYGKTLNHVLELSQALESGLYYAGIRALDESGNFGEPSNAVAIWLESSKTPNRRIDCENTPEALSLNSGGKSITASVVLFISLVTYFLCIF